MDDWIKGVETFMKVSNITSIQRETMWSYIDVDTIEILKKNSFSDHPTLGYEQLKEKMRELFGKEEEHTIDKINRFQNRVQSPGENIKLYALDIEHLAREASGSNCHE